MASAAPKTPFDVRLAARNPLTPIERTVLERCKEAAAAGERAPSIEELTAAIGATGVSTVPGIMNRLEAKGYITRQIYQRGRVVCITETGQCTRPPNDQTPHWRFRTDRVPSPAIQSIRDKAKPVAAMIEAEARLLGKSLPDFLSDLVYIGWHGYQAEKETE
jgi:SOS-response transcriptional repressor LexA